MAIFLKGVQIIIFSENGPKIESTAFLNQDIFMSVLSKNRIKIIMNQQQVEPPESQLYKYTQKCVFI